ncbi:MAG: hypothetical protein PVJ76_07585, partial [Gemmatimonadota bacterium]
MPLAALAALGGWNPAESAWAGVTRQEPMGLAQMEGHLAPEPQAVTELFASDEVLEFVLASDFDRLKKDRSQESEEIPGQVVVRGPQGEGIEIPIQVKTRGNFRLQRRICPDPPLRLDFPETETHGTAFDG